MSKSGDKKPYRGKRKEKNGKDKVVNLKLLSFLYFYLI